MKRVLGLALLGVLAAGIGFFALRALRKPGPADIIQAYFEPYPIPKTAPYDQQFQHWLAAVKHYSVAEYGPAVGELTRADAANEMPSFMVLFYRGQAEMALGEYEMAAIDFDAVLQNRNDIHPLARWYLALAKIGQDKPEEAQPHLQILVEERGYRSRDAAQVLADLGY